MFIQATQGNMLRAIMWQKFCKGMADLDGLMSVHNDLKQNILGGIVCF